MTDIEFRPAAAKDLEEAAQWYEAQRSGLGSEFLEEVQTALDAIVENPEQFPVLYRNTRRALVRRFPYGIYFRSTLTRRLIVACMHGRRRPTRWQVRR